MPLHTERSRYRLPAYALLAVLVLLAAIPGYLTVAPSWRPFAVRLACTVIVVVGCIRVVGTVRRTLDSAPPSALDAPPPAPRPHTLDERFLRTRDDLLFSHRRQRHFDVFLWPRLRTLGGADLMPPMARRRRGPSWSALERLITDIERRP
jgi:hypothetical protein